MNASTGSTVLSQALNIFSFPTVFSLALLLFFLCPVSVTGAAEGSQRVKEAHRGLMRTVLAERVSSLGLRFWSSSSVWVCAYVSVCAVD